MLTNLVKQKIKKFSWENPKEESCGLICSSTGGGPEVFKCKNDAVDKKHFFKINPYDYLKISNRGEIIGCFHSHVNEKVDFSTFDKINSYKLNLTFILYHILSDSFHIIDKEQNNKMFGLNEKFKLGSYDCFSLVRNYYKSELDFEIPNIERKDNWMCDWTETKLKKFYEKLGFKRFNDVGEMQKNDILCMDYFKSNNVSHFAVCLGNGFILHHPRNSNAQINILFPSLLKKILFFLRLQ